MCWLCIIMKMASKVATYASLLDLIAGDNKRQALALLNLLTHEQVEVICEIFSNILRPGVLRLSDVDIKIMKKNKHIIRQIAGIRVGRKRKLKLIRDKAGVIWKILKVIRKYLLN